MANQISSELEQYLHQYLDLMQNKETLRDLLTSSMGMPVSALSGSVTVNRLIHKIANTLEMSEKYLFGEGKIIEYMDASMLEKFMRSQQIMRTMNYNLEDYVLERHDFGKGAFADAMQDMLIAINNFDDDTPPIILMASAYVRRSMAAGLFLQKFMPQDMYESESMMFKMAQQATAEMMGFSNYQETVQFQEDSAQIAFEFMQGYDSRLSKKLISIMVTMVEGNNGKRNLALDSNYENLMQALTILAAEF